MQLCVWVAYIGKTLLGIAFWASQVKVTVTKNRKMLSSQSLELRLKYYHAMFQVAYIKTLLGIAFATSLVKDTITKNRKMLYAQSQD